MDGSARPDSFRAWLQSKLHRGDRPDCAPGQAAWHSQRLDPAGERAAYEEMARRWQDEHGGNQGRHW